MANALPCLALPNALPYFAPSYLALLCHCVVDALVNFFLSLKPGSKPEPIDILRRQLSEKQAAYDEGIYIETIYGI